MCPPSSQATLYNEDCIDTLGRMPAGTVDLVVTSPPYDGLRTYHTDVHKTWGEPVWEPIINELYRVTKEGGVVVWVVGDATINGSETGSSFKQALHFMRAGFRLHDTMIYKKTGIAAPSTGRYYPVFEYMFVFSKGKPATFNPICDRPNKHRERWGKTRTRRDTTGNASREYEARVAPEFGMRTNIWQYKQGHGSGDPVTKYAHPAVFPDSLARDHIITWSNAGDLVYDPFLGSGTTAAMAQELDRRFVGSEVSTPFYELSMARVRGNRLPLFEHREHTRQQYSCAVVSTDPLVYSYERLIAHFQEHEYMSAEDAEEFVHHTVLRVFEHMGEHAPRVCDADGHEYT